MRLADLHPKLSGSLDAGTLRFDCPIPEHGHKIRVPLGTSYWRATGEFPETPSVTPSVNAANPALSGNLAALDSCRWHGNISNGDVSTVP